MNAGKGSTGCPSDMYWLDPMNELAADADDDTGMLW